MTQPPPVEDSRVWKGTLTLTPAGTPGTPVDFSCQVTNIRVTGDYDNDGDNTDTLCGQSLAAPRRNTGYHLAGTFIQDFNKPAGLWAFTFNNELTQCPFEFTPNDTATAPTITGVVTVEMADFGGDVRTRNTTDFDWMCTTKPGVSYPAAV